MQQHEIHNYLYNFFEANNCEILERSPHLLDVQLTIEMDKLLMNRPFIGTILKNRRRTESDAPYSYYKSRK